MPSQKSKRPSNFYKPTSSEGIIAGCDETLEWLLPWWLKRLRSNDSRPVLFVDFGLSTFGRHFCKQHGELLELAHAPLKESIDRKQAENWEKIYGKQLWKSRDQWLKKPRALLSTPFEKNLWLDLDCEVVGSLDPLFALLEHTSVALARETENAEEHERSLGQLLEDEILYNSGVIAYRKDAPLITSWAEALSKRSQEVWGDQQLLSRLIYESKYQIQELDPIYNWRMSQGFNLSAQIIHWVGSWGKEYIRLYSGLGDQLHGLAPRDNS